MTTRTSCLAVVLVALGAAACGRDQPPAPTPTRTQTVPAGIDNPPEASVQRAGPSAVATADASTAARSDSAVGREAALILDVKVTPTKIRNPASETGFDTVRLRSYHSSNTSPDAPFVAPTIRVFPGETVRLTLNNDLDLEEGCDKGEPNTPHCFNTTNMHAHGMWVSPTGNSDNVLLSIPPKTSFQYEYNIPADHPSGTYWYHPHRHGSTAMQVGSGMAGALIVDGHRLPSATAPGDIDTLLRDPNGTPFRERILVLQQIPYACREKDRKGPIKKDADGRWICGKDDVGEVDRHEDIFATKPETWKESGRFTTINGRTAEPLAEHATTGRVERWRLIHAGVRATIKMQFRKRLPSPQPSDVSRIAVADHAAWIDANCDSAQVLDQWEIAADGLTRDQIDVRASTFLQPGYRSDVLVAFPTAGEYCVIDEEADPGAAINGVSANRQLLTMVTVDPATPAPNAAPDIKESLKAAARAFMPASVQEAIVTDLDNRRLTWFVPHDDLRSATPSGTQLLQFSMAGDKPRVSKDHTSDGQQYDRDRVDRQLPLGAIEDWLLKTKIAGSPHPFHIHVNPFQVIAVVDNSGNDLTQTGGSQYFNVKGVWKDTLIVEKNATITVRTHYRRYIGDFVLHCHILDHEDRGMMQNISIVFGDSHRH